MKNIALFILVILFIRCSGQASKISDQSQSITFISVKPKLESRPEREAVIITNSDSLSEFSKLRKQDSIVERSTLRVGNIERNNFGFNEIEIRYSDGTEEHITMLFQIFNGVLFITEKDQIFINDRLALLVESFVIG